MHRKYRIIIIDPSEITREGLKLLLEKNAQLRVVYTLPGLQAFENKHIQQHKFEIIIFNPAVIQFHSAFDVKDLFVNYPDACLIALQTQCIHEAILARFSGTINIYDEGSLLPNKLLHIIEAANSHNDTAKADGISLSAQERKVLIGLAKGLSSKEIADEMSLSTHTIVSYRKNIMQKTAIKTVSGLTLYALFNKLLTPEAVLPASKYPLL